MYSIELTKKATKELRKLHNPILKRLLEAIEKLRENPYPAGCTKLVETDNLWRIRVGDYRIVYNVSEEIKVITITRVAHRKDVYGNL